MDKKEKEDDKKVDVLSSSLSTTVKKIIQWNKVRLNYFGIKELLEKE